MRNLAPRKGLELVMKTNRLSLLAGLAVATSAHAAVVYTSGTLNTAIPDNTSTGLAATLNVTGTAPVTSVSVSLNLSVPAGQAGWFGDLYAYVQHGSGLAVLLNRPGRTDGNDTGYADGQSASLTFADGAANGDIHSYRFTLFGDENTALSGPLTGTWAPDGRAVDPGTVLATDPSSATLSQFNGVNPMGTWTLFLADLSGGGQYQLDSWSLTLNDITPVPEPATLGVVFGAALLGFAAWRRQERRNTSPRA